MTADRKSKIRKEDRTGKKVELKSRTLDVRAIGNMAEHIVVSAALQQVIVNFHNTKRASVMPFAIDMETMVRSHAVDVNCKINITYNNN